ncbi:hypothetical protein DNTS_022890 [Danionella cerebrum]|uniref:Uncharacterized protein n=1 Tax=Danionella cerebrum TaxID=2873325 RepID=A0A553QP89_9TELE|nr:hypothetical protein DNTS_022890 [Danionella translucida]
MCLDSEHHWPGACQSERAAQTERDTRVPGERLSGVCLKLRKTIMEFLQSLSHSLEKPKRGRAELNGQLKSAVIRFNVTESFESASESFQSMFLTTPADRQLISAQVMSSDDLWRRFNGTMVLESGSGATVWETNLFK